MEGRGVAPRVAPPLQQPRRDRLGVYRGSGADRSRRYFHRQVVKASRYLRMVNIDYRHGAAEGDDRRLQFWQATFREDDEDVGYVMLWIVDGADEDLIFSNASWGDVLCARAVRCLSDAPALVVDRVWLEPQYRGRGLGPILLRRVIDTLGRGCDFVALCPGPFGEAQTPEESQRAFQALVRLWESMGFEHFAEDIWLLKL